MTVIDDESMELDSILYRLNKPVQWNVSKASRLGDTWIAEPKYDGNRCILAKIDNEVSLWSKYGNTKNIQFPEVIKAADILPDNTIFDGELCILKNQLVADLAKLQTRTNTTDRFKIKIASKSMPATFMVFDVLKLNDTALHDNSLSTRKTILNRLVFNERIKKVEYYNPDQLIPRIKSENMEGIVLKDMRRSYHDRWIKVKNRVERDFKVIGYTSENRTVSALELEDENGNYVGKVNYNPARFSMESDFVKKLKGMTAVIEYLNGPRLRDPVLKDLR